MQCQLQPIGHRCSRAHETLIVHQLRNPAQPRTTRAQNPVQLLASRIAASIRLSSPLSPPYKMALTDSPEESITAPVALVPSLPDNGSSLRAPVQAQPTLATKPKRICIRIAGIPSAWNDFEIRNTLQTFDADFDPETQVVHSIADIHDTSLRTCRLDFTHE
ncbi:hypothetical protein EX30DRAFT_165496 [Ascodesmis nigricans]|uniref:Uncharacterized protein n=1 Tax=Ascodesmis nigricans TaxID=341454 RepID=A0A4S2MME2_9PEZI|nr:hypothetical protein EX30DRAFT_165496 [Ascodesmis nigricans]